MNDDRSLLNFLQRGPESRKSWSGEDSRSKIPPCQKAKTCGRDGKRNSAHGGIEGGKHFKGRQDGRRGVSCIEQRGFRR